MQHEPQALRKGQESQRQQEVRGHRQEVVRWGVWTHVWPGSETVSSQRQKDKRTPEGGSPGPRKLAQRSCVTVKRQRSMWWRKTTSEGPRLLFPKVREAGVWPQRSQSRLPPLKGTIRSKAPIYLVLMSRWTRRGSPMSGGHDWPHCFGLTSTAAFSKLFQTLFHADVVSEHSL